MVTDTATGDAWWQAEKRANTDRSIRVRDPSGMERG